MKASPRDALLMVLLVCIAFAACLTLMITRLYDSDTLESRESESSDSLDGSALSYSLDPTNSPTTSDIRNQLDSPSPPNAADPIAPSTPTVSPFSPMALASDDRECPLALSISGDPLKYQRGSFCETWRGLSDKTCEDLAAQLLISLQQAQTKLIHAGYLDLAGESWGCAAKSADGEALTITLIPQKRGVERGEENQLCMTVLRIKAPDFSDPIPSEYSDE